MPAYRWTCPACGHANDAGAPRCTSCQCPAAFSARDVDHHRRLFVEGGGTVEPGAAVLMEKKDFAIFQTLFAVPLLFLGAWWPVDLLGKKDPPGDPPAR